MNFANNNPKVTVLMPVYNGEKYLREAIDSILNQTFTDFEFLIINDGSTDSSVEIINSYDDSRIRLIHNEKNLKLVASLNKGIDLAKGDYIARMDADDISLLERLDRQVRFMDVNCNIDICGTFIKTFGLDNEQIWKYPLENEDIKVQMLFSCPLAHPSVILRRESLNKYNLRYDLKFFGAEDFEFWSRCSEKLILANIPEVLLKYRINPNSITNCYRTVQLDLTRQVIESNLAKLDIKNESIIHFLLERKKLTFKDFIFISGFLDYIIKKNREKTLYDEKALYIVVEQKFSHFCNTSAYLGLKVFKEWYYFYRKHDIYKLLSIQTLKLLVKCLIRYNVKR